MTTKKQTPPTKKPTAKKVVPAKKGTVKKEVTRVNRFVQSGGQLPNAKKTLAKSVAKKATEKATAKKKRAPLSDKMKQTVKARKQAATKHVVITQPAEMLAPGETTPQPVTLETTITGEQVTTRLLPAALRLPPPLPIVAKFLLVPASQMVLPLALPHAPRPRVMIIPQAPAAKPAVRRGYPGDFYKHVPPPPPPRPRVTPLPPPAQIQLVQAADAAGRKRYVCKTEPDSRYHVRNRSQVERPVAVVRKVCYDYPQLNRKQVLELCVSMGVDYNTASTQYSIWKKASQQNQCTSST